MIVAIVGAVGVFIVGAKYGANAEKRAVAVGLAVFTEAKVKLYAAVTRAQATAKADADRLEALAKKYL